MITSTNSNSMKSKRRPLRLAATWLTLALIVGCGDSTSPPTPTPTPGESGDGKAESRGTLPSAAQPQLAPPAPAGTFAGIRQCIALADGVFLEWEPVSGPEQPNVRYRIYLANESGEQKFTQPNRTTEANARSAKIDGLPAGKTIFVVVRALWPDGREDRNEVEWAACPNPVRYVDYDSKHPAPTGKSADDPFRNIGDAIDSAIALDGVNIYVRGGEKAYERRVVLLDGAVIYGGFDSTFGLTTRDTAAHPTTLQTQGAKSLITVIQGERFCGLDGLVLRGNGQTERGIAGDAGIYHIANTRIDGFRLKGIDLRGATDLETPPLSGTIRNCTVTGTTAGEGIHLEGALDLSILDCVVEGSANEGIEATLAYLPGEKTRLKIERCQIVGNRSLGIEIDLTEGESEGDLGNARFRARVRDCRIAYNGDHGVGVDVRYEETTPIDLGVEVESNRLANNQGAGVHLDVDAPGEYRVAHNVVVANHLAAPEGKGAGILLTGDAEQADVSLAYNRVGANGTAGVDLQLESVTRIEQCNFFDNFGPAILQGESSKAHVSGSVLLAHPVASTVAELTESFVAKSATEGHLPRYPRAVYRAERLDGRVVLAADTAKAVSVGQWVELGDDGIARRVTSVDERGVVLTPSSEGTGPTVLFVWDSNDVEEDDSIPAGTPAAGRGILGGPEAHAPGPRPHR